MLVALRASFLILFCSFSGLLFSQSTYPGDPVDTNDHVIDILNQYIQDSVAIDPALLQVSRAVQTVEAPTLVNNPETEWNDWSVVENYAFGKNRGSLTMVADLRALHPFFRDRVTELIRQCSVKGITVAVVETFRTHAKQNEYKTMGGKYTNSAGGRSKHQYGLAVDIVPMVDGKPQWDNQALWRKVGIIGESLGLRWGGRWKRPYDPAHFEWSGGLTTTHLASGMLPAISDEEYPCIHEDMETLRVRWKEWETFQSVSY
jgi:peptidoglycan L-alanyl-D-glutamate endopeptidase CwlK